MYYKYNKQYINSRKPWGGISKGQISENGVTVTKSSFGAIY